MEAVRSASKHTGKKVLFLVDGLDEIYRLDPSFVSLLFTASAPKVVWMCAGRGEPPELEMALRHGGAQGVFPEGLPALNEQAIRAMLTAHLERRKYQLFARDRVKDGEWRNRFVEVMVHKSKGLPLYVRMAIEDLLQDKWTIEDEEKLPDGLQAYFEHLLERLRMSDVGTVLTPLFCLLVWAKEPVTEAVLRQLLGGHYLSKSPRWEELFRKALAHGHLMLRRAPTPESEAGWTFYHDTFRQHLLASHTVRDNREWAQEAWLEGCARWPAL